MNGVDGVNGVDDRDHRVVDRDERRVESHRRLASPFVGDELARPRHPGRVGRDDRPSLRRSSLVERLDEEHRDPFEAGRHDARDDPSDDAPEEHAGLLPPLAAEVDEAARGEGRPERHLPCEGLVRTGEDAVSESRGGREGGTGEGDRLLEVVQLAPEEGEPLPAEAGVGEADLDEVDPRPLQRLLGGEDDRGDGRRLEDEEGPGSLPAPPSLHGVEEARVDVGEEDVIEDVPPGRGEPRGEGLLDGGGGPADERQVAAARDGAGAEEGFLSVLNMISTHFLEPFQMWVLIVLALSERSSPSTIESHLVCECFAKPVVMQTADRLQTPCIRVSNDF